MVYLKFIFQAKNRSKNYVAIYKKVRNHAHAKIASFLAQEGIIEYLQKETGKNYKFSISPALYSPPRLRSTTATQTLNCGGPPSLNNSNGANSFEEQYNSSQTQCENSEEPSLEEYLESLHIDSEQFVFNQIQTRSHTHSKTDEPIVADDDEHENSSSSRHRNYITTKLAESYTLEELLQAASKAALRENKPVCRKVIRSLITDPENSAKEISEALLRPAITPNDEFETMDLCVRTDSGRNKLQTWRNNAVSHGAKQYLPSKHKILQAKVSHVYPPDLDLWFKVNDNEAIISLLALAPHTAREIVDLLPDERLRSVTELTVIASHGMDGTDHANYKQAYSSDTDKDIHEQLATRSPSLISTFSPLRLVDQEGRVVWRSPSPCSPRYNRMLRVAFEKESEKNCLAEFSRVQSEIHALKPFSYKGKSLFFNNNR